MPPFIVRPGAGGGELPPEVTQNLEQIQLRLEELESGGGGGGGSAGGEASAGPEVMVWRGEWNATDSYPIGSILRYQDSLYRAGEDVPPNTRPVVAGAPINLSLGTIGQREVLPYAGTAWLTKAWYGQDAPVGQSELRYFDVNPGGSVKIIFTGTNGSSMSGGSERRNIGLWQGPDFQNMNIIGPDTAEAGIAISTGRWIVGIANNSGSWYNINLQLAGGAQFYVPGGWEKLLG